jgi:hypothetical protein
MIALQRVVPEAMEPRKIAIGGGGLPRGGSTRRPMKPRMLHQAKSALVAAPRRVQSSGVQLRRIDFPTPSHLMEDD